METFYITIDDSDKIMFETSSNRMVKSVAIDFLIEGAKKVYVHNRVNGKTITYPEKPRKKNGLHAPVVAVNADGNPCFLWSADNPDRNDNAEYDIINRQLTIAGKIVDAHPAFQGLKPFRDFVSRYLAEGRDGYDTHAVLDKIVDIHGLADYINCNPKTWRYEIFPYIKKKGWAFPEQDRNIIAKQDGKFLAVGAIGQASILNDNNRLELVDKLQMRIKQSGLPMKVISERSGISRGNIYKILRGTYNPTIDLLDKLVRVLGMKIDLVDK